MKTIDRIFSNPITIVLLVFLFLFNIKFISFPWMPTSRFVFFILVLFFLLRTTTLIKKELTSNYLYYFTLFFVILYVLVLFFMSGGMHFDLISRMIIFCIFGVFMSFAFSSLPIDLGLFCRSVAFACFLQAFFVYISFFSESYRIFLSGILIETSNIPITYSKRVPGFSNSSGSLLSLLLSFGVFFFMCLLVNTQNRHYKVVFLLCAIFIAISCLFVGKLGLFLSVYFIFATFFVRSKKIRYLTFVLILLSCFLVLISYIYSKSSSVVVENTVHLEGFQYALSRSFSLFSSEGDSTLKALLLMPIPSLDINTMLGHGYFIDALGRNVTNSDVGYVQSYYSLGLIFSLVFYVSLFFYLFYKIIRVRDMTLRNMAFIFFLPLFVVELKEPFITKLGYVFLLLTYLFLCDRDKNSVHHV